MGRKRRRLVFTITETWTFVFDAEDRADTGTSVKRPALGPISAPSPDAAPEDVSGSDSTPDQPLTGETEPLARCDAGDDAETSTQ